MEIDTYPGHQTADKPAEYQEALKLAEAGQSEEALACIQEYLASAPHDAEALNDTGAILFSLGYTDEAVNHLEKARQLYPDAAEITWNLLEAYLAIRQPQQAANLFDDMDRMGTLNADVLNRTADVYLKNEKLAEAVLILQQSLERWPDQEVLRPMIDVIRSKMVEYPC